MLHAHGFWVPGQVWQGGRNKHTSEQSVWDGEVLGTTTRGAAAPHSTCLAWLAAGWPLTRMGRTHHWESGSHSEQIQALEHVRALLGDQWTRSLFNPLRFRDQGIKLFLSRRAFPQGFPCWPFAHNTITWLWGPAESFLIEDSSPAKVNTVLSYCKLNNLVRK